MAPRPVTRETLVSAIKENGPMSADELTEVTGLTRGQVHGAITGSRALHGTKYFRIVRFERTTGTGGAPAPVYACTPGKDAVWTPLGEKETSRQSSARYREKMRGMIQAKDRKRRGKTVNMWAQLMLSV